MVKEQKENSIMSKKKNPIFMSIRVSLTPFIMCIVIAKCVEEREEEEIRRSYNYRLEATDNR